MVSNRIFSKELVKRVGKRMADKECMSSRFTIERTPQQIKDDFRFASENIRSTSLGKE